MNSRKHRTRGGRRAVTWAAACALAGGGLAGGALATAGQALAQSGTACPSPVLNGTTETVTCTYTGAAQYWTAPAGVTEATFTLYGAEGGASGDTGAAGLGAAVTGMVPVTASTVLQVNAGQAGAPHQAGTFGGGGSPEGDAAGGGGETDVRVADADGDYPLSNALLVAGGGGGGGQIVISDNGPGPGGAAGGNADSPGSAGPSGDGNCGETLGGGAGGGAGTTSAGGLGGADGTVSGPCDTSLTVEGGSAGGNGGPGTGGSAGSPPGFDGGGGGGGGYNGGGAGGGPALDIGAGSREATSGGGGGGGGASYTGSTGAAVTDGVAAPDDAPNGEVIISYADPVSTGVPSFTTAPGEQLNVTAPDGLLSTAVTSAPAGDTLTASTASSPETTAQGGTVTVNSDGSFSYTPPSATFTGTDSFSYTVTDEYGDSATGTAMVDVQPVAIPVTVTGSQVYGSSGPQFTATYTAPSGVTVSGSVTCATVNGGTAIGPDLDAGSYTIDGLNCSGLSASGGYTLSYTGGQFTVSPVGQAISFTAPATGTVGQTAALTATGGASGDPVTFSVDPSSGAGVCSVSGDTVSYTAAGSCVIDANQAGDTDYAAAAQVQQTIAVRQVPAFTADSPPVTAATGTPYSYQFNASGVPAPTFSLNSGAPSWLSVSASTGLVSGIPPAGTRSFSYAVTAANAAGSVTTSTFTVAVTSSADVKAALSCPAGLTVGESGTCTLTVTNAGPALAVSTAAGAAVTGPLTVTGCSDECSRVGGLLGWSLGSLPAGQSVTLTISVTAAKAGTAVVAAADGSANPDPDLFNNIAAATVKITKS
jgi:hypothetical protein